MLVLKFMRFAGPKCHCAPIPGFLEFYGSFNITIQIHHWITAPDISLNGGGGVRIIFKCNDIVVLSTPVS